MFKKHALAEAARALSNAAGLSAVTLAKPDALFQHSRKAKFSTSLRVGLLVKTSNVWLSVWVQVSTRAK